MTKKLCPIPAISEFGHSYKSECEEEKCAWFHEETGNCSIVFLHSIAFELFELRRSDETEVETDG